MSLKILLIDDSSFMRSLIKKVLYQTGLKISNIVEASNGKEGYTILKNTEIDLVLSDINMPLINGLELLKLMKADDSQKSIPIIMVTTEGTEDVIQLAKSYGASGFIKKPFTPELLAAQIKSLFDIPDLFDTNVAEEQNGSDF